MDAKATDSFRDRNLSVNYSCSYFSNLIGRRTINIPEIILGVHGLMGFTVRLKESKENLLKFVNLTFYRCFYESLYIPTAILFVYDVNDTCSLCFLTTVLHIITFSRLRVLFLLS